MSLYAIDMEMQAVLDAMLDGGVDSPEAMEALNQHLAGLESMLHQKAEKYASLIRELEVRSKARAEEAARIRALATVDGNLATRLKERLKEVMERTGTTRIETHLFRLSVAANGGKQPMTIEETAVPELPKEFTVTTVEPDRERIRAALESGMMIPGCTLLPRGTSLRIK
jgi:hypothetical protein